MPIGNIVYITGSACSIVPAIRSAPRPGSAPIATRRTVPANHCEDLAMREALADPAAGAVVMKSMGDTRWKGWSKMQLTHTCPDGKKVVIHYVGEFEKGTLKHVDDFKFKDN